MEQDRARSLLGIYVNHISQTASLIIPARGSIQPQDVCSIGLGPVIMYLHRQTSRLKVASFEQN